MIELSTSIAENLREIRARKPLIHNITNFVVMNSTANVLLALGASPVMAHAVDEVEEMVSYAGALVLNIGTLERPWIEAMILSARKATTLKTPIVLDPVGAGATRLRTETCGRILAEAKVSVVRGNASEILALGAGLGGGKGVDATHGVDEAEGVAVVNTVLCKGCGVCTASCRMNAADLNGFNNEEVLAQIGALS